MESEITNAETGLELPLAEPHFDDEATVLSARRVVPLDQVESFKAQTQSRFARGWVFAATIAGAMLLGVCRRGLLFLHQPSTESPVVRKGKHSCPALKEWLPNQPVITMRWQHPRPAVPTPADADTQVSVKEAPAVSQPDFSSNETSKPVARRVAVLTWPSSHERAQSSSAPGEAAEERIRARKPRPQSTRIREIFEGPQRP